MSLLGTSWLCGATSAPEDTCVVSLPGDVSLVWRILAVIVAGYLLLLVTLDPERSAERSTAAGSPEP
ncbi:hypothetical protein AB0L64_20950 [Kribbella sp. NPDC051936]|uniref:hypothetical protein n=1 Tax=Kribbella sp. NPDC051936 TaxID=3154946 RepID=UPI003415B06F